MFFFFFQAEDGIRDGHVTGVQTCALPISPSSTNTPSRSCRTYGRRTDSTPTLSRTSTMMSGGGAPALMETACCGVVMISGGSLSAGRSATKVTSSTYQPTAWPAMFSLGAASNRTQTESATGSGTTSRRQPKLYPANDGSPASG